MTEPTQGELLPPDDSPKCEHCGDVGYCEECGVDHDEAEASEEVLEPPDPEVEALLKKLDGIEHESKAALHALQSGGTNFTVDDCDCEQCKAIAPVVKAMREKAKPCSCRVCLLTTEGGALGHSGSCACKLCRAARGAIQVTQQLRGIIENEW
jgi:hypothetical protein